MVHIKPLDLIGHIIGRAGVSIYGLSLRCLLLRDVIDLDESELYYFGIINVLISDKYSVMTVSFHVGLGSPEVHIDSRNGFACFPGVCFCT